MFNSLKEIIFDRGCGAMERNKCIRMIITRRPSESNNARFSRYVFMHKAAERARVAQEFIVPLYFLILSYYHYYARRT